MKALIYSKDNCPYCDKAKTLFKIKKIPYTENRIGEHVTREEFLEMFPDQRTVPLIFIDNVKVGGYEDFIRFLDAQKHPA